MLQQNGTRYYCAYRGLLIRREIRSHRYSAITHGLYGLRGSKSTQDILTSKCTVCLHCPYWSLCWSQSLVCGSFRSRSFLLWFAFGSESKPYSILWSLKIKETISTDVPCNCPSHFLFFFVWTGNTELQGFFWRIMLHFYKLITLSSIQYAEKGSIWLAVQKLT